MVLADGIILGVAVLFLVLGVITGFGRGLEIISKGIFGKIFSLVMCYFFIGLVIKIPAVSGLMESFVTMLKDKGEWWSNILLTIRVDIIAVVIIMLVVITFVRILVVQLVKNIFAQYIKTNRVKYLPLPLPFFKNKEYRKDNKKKSN